MHKAFTVVMAELVIFVKYTENGKYLSNVKYILSIFLLELFTHAVINIIVSYYSVLTYSMHTCILERFVAEKLVVLTILMY